MVYNFFQKNYAVSYVFFAIETLRDDFSYLISKANIKNGNLACFPLKLYGKGKISIAFPIFNAEIRDKTHKIWYEDVFLPFLAFCY